ncbi:MAG TPA: DUF1207 domain-containing protein [Nitrospiraceae bacterium]|nr:DUF1207 domain-containing protein [Nitrospiraceae bacterium]
MLAYILVFVTFLFLGSSAAAADDAYIAGYAAAILEHEFSVTDAVIQVDDGVVTVSTKSIGRVDRGKILAALKKIPGVRNAEVNVTSPEEIGTAGPVDGLHESEEGVQTGIPGPQPKWLPRGFLFSPLHADPRWSHFGASYRNFTAGLGLSGVFGANFGETFSIYRNRAPFGGEWDFGVQAGVFSIFDVSKQSIDLVNADYLVGLMSSYRNGRFSGFVRIHHQSSHLGDEFLLNNAGVERINLSFEELDAKLSYELTSWLRVYGGGGVLVHRYPRIGRGTTQWGMELTSPKTYLEGRLRPVAYADFQANERANWTIARSIMAGFQFENARIGDRQIQLLAEYFAGPAPDGQFYTSRVEWIGVGLHFYF